MDARLERLKKIPLGAVIAVVALAGLWQMSRSDTAAVRVPDLVGRPVKAAETIAKANGFRTKIVRVPRGGIADTVLGQRPDPASIHNRGEVIELEVTKGAKQVRVPDLRNVPVDDARRYLVKAGLTPGDVTYERAPGKETGRVITTTPKPLSVVDAQTTVALIAAS